MERDWNGNSKSIYSVLGASNHSEGERAIYDYYATDPKAMRLLMQKETFSPTIWECACGEGHLSKELVRGGYRVHSSDLVDRGYGSICDFLECNNPPDELGDEFDIITNPPYSKASEFVYHGMKLLPEGRKLILFLKLQFLEGKSRRKMFELYPPKKIYVSSSRILCAKNGMFDVKMDKSSAVAYAWYIWEKGFTGEPVIKWFN